MFHRILCIDDDASFTQPMRCLLELAGYFVRVENDAPRALRAAQEFHPDVILLDYRMPGMNGVEVAWQLMCEPVCRSAALIVCTGRFPEDFAHQLPPVPTWFVRKPFRIKELLRVIAQSVSGRAIPA